MTMDIQEITLQKLDSEKFIQEWAEKIQSKVGEGLAVNALSGGVDSSVVTLIGDRALDKRLKTYFIENGLIREGEPE
ncbi:MAG: ExsB family transcriptional regulator, partial [Deltaproteobacteria bacterium]|nr:ExsB family transcriptional regulator [Deltaproteobacteria bacterium]